MNSAEISKAMDRIEELLKDADGKAFMLWADLSGVPGADSEKTIGDMRHSIGNARQVAAGVKVMCE